MLIDAGESVKAVAEYLGHADVGFTLRVYAHLFPASEDRARKAVETAFSAALREPRTAHQDALLTATDRRSDGPQTDQAGQAGR